MTGETAAASGTPIQRKSAEVPTTWMASTPTLIQPRITAYRSRSRCSPRRAARRQVGDVGELEVEHRAEHAGEERRDHEARGRASPARVRRIVAPAASSRRARAAPRAGGVPAAERPRRERAEPEQHGGDREQRRDAERARERRRGEAAADRAERAARGDRGRRGASPAARSPARRASVQNTSTAIASICFATMTRSGEGARHLGDDQEPERQQNEPEEPEHPAEQPPLIAARGDAARRRRSCPASRIEFTRKTSGRRSTPMRFRKNVSATLVTDTDAHSTRNRAPGPGDEQALLAGLDAEQALPPRCQSRHGAASSRVPPDASPAARQATDAGIVRGDQALVLAHDHERRDEPADDEDDVHEEEVLGREVEHLDADQDRERRHSVAQADEERVDRGLGRVLHLGRGREPDDLARRVVDRVVGRVLRDLHHADDAEHGERAPSSSTRRAR